MQGACSHSRRPKRKNTMECGPILRTLSQTVLSATALAPLATAIAQDAPQSANGAPIVEIEQVVVTGTRVADRSSLETAVPVDVVSNEALENVGVTEINQTLSVTVP